MPIAVVSIPVADQQAAKRFYVGTMGFDLVREVPMGPGSAWIQLRPADGGATIALTTWFEAMGPGGVGAYPIRTCNPFVPSAVEARARRLVTRTAPLDFARDERTGSHVRKG